MSEQYTPIIASAQTYLATLHKETITLQEQEIVRLRRDLAKAQTTIGMLLAQVRDLELDITMVQPRQIVQIGVSPISQTPLSKTQRVKQMALAAGVSESTMWRNIQRGIIVMED